MFFSTPTLLIFTFMSRIQSFIFPVVTDSICKITELAEDLTQLHYSVKDIILNKGFFPRTISKEKDEVFQTVIKIYSWSTQAIVYAVVLILTDPPQKKRESCSKKKV